MGLTPNQKNNLISVLSGIKECLKQIDEKPMRKKASVNSTESASTITYIDLDELRALKK